MLLVSPSRNQSVILTRQMKPPKTRLASGLSLLVTKTSPRMSLPTTCWVLTRLTGRILPTWTLLLRSLSTSTMALLLTLLLSLSTSPLP